MFLATTALALLAIQSQVRLVVQLGHSAPVHAVAYSPDGRIAVTTSADATAKIWDTATGHELRTLAGHTDEVDAVAFSPDGRFVATGSRDKTAKLWDTATGAEIRTFPHGNGWILAVAFSPDGKHVLTGGWDSAVTFWNAATGEPVRTLTGFEKGITSIAVSPDGRRIVTGSSDTTARIWDAVSGAALHTLAGHTNTVTAVAFSPDARLVATASWDQTVRLWNAADGAHLRTLAHHTAEVTAVAFSPDGRRVLSGSRDRSALLWDTESGKALGATTGHTDWISSVAFSPDGRYLLTGSHDRTTRQWDSRGKVQPLTLTGRSSGLCTTAYSPDGRVVATAGRDGITTLWDVDSGQPARFLAGHDHWVMAVAFTPDGKSVVTASRDGTVKLWSARSGTPLRTLTHTAPVTAVAFSPDGRLLATRALNQSATVWDVGTGTTVHAFVPKESPVDSIAFSPDGRYLVTGWSAAAQIWDVTAWKPVRVIGPHTFDFELRAVAFSPDGRVLLTASGDGSAKLWNAVSGAALRTINAHSDEIRSAVFSSDGRFILTGSSDRTAKLWRADTGAEVRTFSGHTGAVDAAVFSRDGRFAVTASDDGTARLWELDSGTAISTLVSFPGGMWAVVDREGRFDASNSGEVEGLHWVVGNEVIALHQLRSRYYDPFLLAKLVGSNRNELVNVASLDRVALGPDVHIRDPEKGSTKLAFSVLNRGGGIGNVRVLVNRKELVDDACGTRHGSSAERVDCTADLTRAHLRPGHDNTIEVVAWNTDETVSSRGVSIQRTGGAKQVPELYAIVVGISEYASPAIRLKYAAKDAMDIAAAIELGAHALFGTERVHLTRLVTGDPLLKPPTKRNLEEAFRAAERATPDDVLVVYFAGHGTAIANDYVFPTRDATEVALHDSPVRQRDAVTGSELAEWIKKIPALKQVMILDTCAAGAAAASLQAAARTERSSIVRALERLSSRTGFHILMGSAADAVSYESDGVAQGLLTYTLLQGMRGAALRDGEYVDVAKLFQHAADEVPLLTKNKDRVQRPMITAPRGLTFDIGRLSPDARAKIPRATTRPAVLRPLLLDSEAGSDDLALTAALTNALREYSYATGRMDFIGEETFSGAVRAEGMYRVVESRAVVSLVLKKDGVRIRTIEVAGSATDIQVLAEKLAMAICDSIISDSAGPRKRNESPTTTEEKSCENCRSCPS